MWRPTLEQRIYHKTRDILTPALAASRRNKLNNVDFSIISNNCWGGVTYEYYGIKKLSPTVGLFFFSEDYLKFLKNLDYYLGLSIKIVDSRRSKWYKQLEKQNSTQALIGLLDDIEVIFLHYKDVNIAYDKWNRRVSRINKNNMIFKFSYMNMCTEAMLKEFYELDLSYFTPFYKKIMFTANSNHDYDCAVYYKGFEKEKQILNDTYLFDYYFDVTSFINGEGIIKKH